MKLLSAFCAVMLMASSVMAGRAFVIPSAANGNPLVGDGYGGANYALVTASNTETAIFSGRGILIGIVTSTGTPATDYVIFKDTSAVSNDITDSPRMAYKTTASVESLPFPLRVTNGLVTDSQKAVADGLEYVVIYIDEEL